MCFLQFYYLFIYFWCGLFLKSLLNFLQYCLCFMFSFFGHKAYGILALLPGIKPTPPMLEGKGLTPGPLRKSHQVYSYNWLLSILLWFKKKFDMTSIFLNLLRFILWPNMWSILENVTWVVNVLLLCGMFSACLLSLPSPMCHLRLMFHYDFSSEYLSKDVNEVLKPYYCIAFNISFYECNYFICIFRTLPIYY